MSRRIRVIINVVALQAGWFVCVMGGSGDFPGIGPGFVLAHVCLHLLLTREKARDAVVIVVVTIIGIVADGVLLRTGAIAFDSGVLGRWIAQLWMIALWTNFATSLNLTLAFLRGRFALATLFGAIGGATAYWGGVRFGALSMPLGEWQGAAAVALEWAIVTPFLIWISARLSPQIPREPELCATISAGQGNSP